MKITRRLTLIGLGLVVVATAGVYRFSKLDPDQQKIADALAKISAVTEGKGSLSTTIELIQSDGLPKELQNAKIELQLAGSDRLRIATTIKEQRVELGRDGQSLWAWEPGKNFAVLGTADVPKYATRPNSVEKTTLGPLTIPKVKPALDLLPHFCSVQKKTDEVIDGAPTDVLKATLLPAAQPVLGFKDASFTLWLRKADAAPLKLEVENGTRMHVTALLHDVSFGAAIDAATFKLPPSAEPHVTRVALAHLSKFLDTVPSVINKPRMEPLGPATGSVKLLATHGGGRLEDHDGTRVLYLKGTPEQMGEQMGTLMKSQVRDVVKRVLYGVGVGSSLAKGEWFFGTIERCQGRIAKFVEPRHLGEMDAIAKAADLDPEEVRLANFFPELFHCSGFALHGAATKDGHLYHGRILDYMVGVGLEPNAVVIVSQSDQGHAWVNISYAGFIGSVTAMNDSKISIGEMGGRGEGNWDGKPMAQLVREVMEKAGTLDEAVEIMRSSPRTCEYYYVIADGKTKQSVGIKATPEIFEVVHPGEAHPQLPNPQPDTVMLSAGDRYTELTKRVKAGYGTFDAISARALMTRPVCMNSNIHSVLFQTDTLDFWVANADSKNPAAHARYTHYNLDELLTKQAPSP